MENAPKQGNKFQRTLDTISILIYSNTHGT